MGQIRVVMSVVVGCGTMAHDNLTSPWIIDRYTFMLHPTPGQATRPSSATTELIRPRVHKRSVAP